MTPLVIDNFAGGGGASYAIEQALGRPVDIAINHDPEAIAMHRANHPTTRHLCQDVWSVNPAEVTRGHTVGLAWFSPDCKHFSKAKGAAPVRKEVRDLAWVVIRWARAVRPRVIMLENVEEFRQWGPLLPNRKPCPKRLGFTFRRWVSELERQGYNVDYRELRAADYGGPTIRKRLFLVARCDGRPIAWPEPTHNEHGTDGLKKWRGASELVDWSLPCPSIFDTSEEIFRKYGVRARRPLADATMKRIAAGVMQYVVNAEEPYFVSYAQQGGRNRSAYSPMHTITASRKDQNCVVAPTLIQTGYGERKGQAPRALDLRAPLGTVVAGGCKHALVSAFLAQHNTGLVGRSAEAPFSTIVSKGCTQALVAAHLLNHKGSQRSASSIESPTPTVCASTTHASMVAAFLAPYYTSGSGQKGRSITKPAPTVTTRGRLQLVTVNIHGDDYVICDIGMRMFTPRELFRAQGFPDSYVINPPAEPEQGLFGTQGQPLTKTAQIRMCGNSVCPDVAAALVRANVDTAELGSAATAR